MGVDNYTITIAFDDEAQRWYAINDDIPIVLEDDSLDTLINRINNPALKSNLRFGGVCCSHKVLHSGFNTF